MKLIQSGVALLLVVLASCGAGEDGTVVAQRTEAIVNGTPTAADSLPSVGLLYAMEGKTAQLCTATLISDQLLLTAAHCVAEIPKGSTVGFFTGNDISARDAASKVIRVASYTAHPSFADSDQPPSTLTDYYDIAVAKLAKSTTITPAKMIRPAELSNLLKGGSSLLIVGYGETVVADTQSVGVKMQGTTSISKVGSSELMTGEPPAAQTCSGDSGGPHFAGPSDNLRIVGVTSRGGEKCDVGAIATRVDSYLSWIHSFGDIPCSSGLSELCPGEVDELASTDSGGCNVVPFARPAESVGMGAVLLAVGLAFTYTFTRRRRLK